MGEWILFICSWLIIAIWHACYGFMSCFKIPLENNNCTNDFTRGYAYKYGKRREISNYGDHVKGKTDYYGVLQEIIEVGLPGLVNLKCILLKCDWFDSTVDWGARINKFGVPIFSNLFTIFGLLFCLRTNKYLIMGELIYIFYILPVLGMFSMFLICFCSV